MVMVTGETARIWELLQPFEREILERYAAMGKMAHPVTGVRGWKGLWIRGRLLEVGSTYVYGLYKSWRTFCEQAEVLGVKIKPGNYQSFRTYFHLLKQLGLVREHLRIPKHPGEKGLPKVHYEAIIERIDDPAWTRPFQEKYPSTDWTRLPPEERRELREKYRRSK